MALELKGAGLVEDMVDIWFDYFLLWWVSRCKRLTDRVIPAVFVLVGKVGMVVSVDLVPLITILYM
jgi:hypothetical protein